MATAVADTKNHPLRALVDQWIEKIDTSIRLRDERFGCYAKEAEQFFDSNHDFMWKGEYASGKGGFLDKDAGILPTFRITVNKLFEAVALFGPALYHQNPQVMVSSLPMPEVPPEALGVLPEDPVGMAFYQQMAMQDEYQQVVKDACSSIKQRYLNWLQYETDKKRQSRRAITEAIVSGLGLLKTELYQPPFSNIKMPRSRYLSWRDFTIDPDADYYEDANWIACRCVQAVNLVEEKYGLEPGSLKGHYQSIASQASKRAKKEANQNRPGQSFDLIEYWEIYSKNGFGHKLNNTTDLPAAEKHNFDAFGKYCYIVVARGVPFPLNMPSEVLTNPQTQVEELFERSQWPIPFWYDASADGGWPVARLMFYDKPKSVWPISLFKPAIGELRFINWCLSFLADKVASSCTTYVGVLKSAAEEIRRQIRDKTGPFTIVEISEVLSQSGKLSDIVSFLESPQFSMDIWKMVAEVLELIDKRTGLTELIYGLTGSQMRSATEANVRNENLAVRPDDMAQSVENWLGEVAVREMQTARWFCEGPDVLPVVGQRGAMVWEQYVLTADPDAVVRDYDYRIEAGSARKPNKANRIQQLQDLGQYVLPVMQEFCLQGITGPWNAYMKQLGKAMDINDIGEFLVTPDMLPQQNGPSPEQVQMEAKLAELQMKQQEMGMKLQFDAESHDQEMEQDREKHKLEMEQAKQDMKMKEQQAKTQVSIAKETAKAKVAAAKAKPKPSTKKK